VPNGQVQDEQSDSCPETAFSIAAATNPDQWSSNKNTEPVNHFSRCNLRAGRLESIHE